MKARYHIGVDPGQPSGFAVWDRMRKAVVYYEKTEFWGILERLEDWPAIETEVTVEYPSLSRKVFQRPFNPKPGENIIQAARRELKIASQIGRRVGMVSREAELLVEAIERAGYRVNKRIPSGKKWDALDLEVYTGIDARTNEDVRDAIRFVFGS